MKVCPQCNAQYDDSMFFCLEDGATLRTPTDVNLEQTLAMPKPEKIPTIPPTGEEILNLPKIGEETLALPNPNSTAEKSVGMGSWQPVTTPPQPIPTPETNLNLGKTALAGGLDSRETSNLDSNKSGGKGIYILLAGLIGGIVLIGSGYVGWRLSQPAAIEVANANVNKQTQNSNVNSTLPNTNLVGYSGENNANFSNQNNSNISNANVNSSPNTNANKATPKPSPTKDKSPTPTPNETPTPTPTPTPKTPTPTPTPSPTPTRKPPDIVRGGVLNGKSIFLYQPKYPPAAKAAGVGGQVQVQVIVDENGSVIAARAVSGHPLLRQTSETAARSSKFTPTTIDGQRVKVTGVIVYNFVAN